MAFLDVHDDWTIGTAWDAVRGIGKPWRQLSQGDRDRVTATVRLVTVVIELRAKEDAKRRGAEIAAERLRLVLQKVDELIAEAR